MSTDDLFGPRPHDHEAEQLVLGAALLGGGRTVDVLVSEVKLAASHFDRAGHGFIYQSMIELQRAGEGVDKDTVRFALERKLGAQMDTSQRAQLELLAGTVPDLGNYRQYANRVKELAVWRDRRLELMRKAEAVAHMNSDEWTAAAAVETVELAGHDGLLTPEMLGDMWMDWYDRSTENVISTPWQEITEGLFGGFRPGDTTVLAGHSGMGKTTAGDQQLGHAKDTHASNCCIYVNEMSEVDRVSRLLAGRAAIPFKKIMRRELSPAEAKAVLKEAPALPYSIQPCAGWSADAIAAHLRRYRWDMAFLDLATRIPARLTSDWDYISGTLADAARQSGTHLILAVQLNRERNTGAERPMPVLRDLRNTGAWEADARNVVFVHRREEMDREKGVPVLHDDGVIQLAKVSNGRQGAAERVYMDYARMRFKPLVTDNQQQSNEEFWTT